MTARRPHRIGIKRVYETPAPDDGWRVLVDRIWPRGVARERLALDAWLKDVAPTSDLRRWFNHDPSRWLEFAARYGDELRKPPASDAMDELVSRARQGPLTLVYAASNETHNNAAALRDIIARRLSHHGSARSHGRSS
jgi:uncharacterized protein YeaO (DUF488 family)